MGSMENFLEIMVKGSLVLLGVGAAAVVLVPLAILYLAWLIAKWILGVLGSLVFPLDEEKDFYGGYRMSGFARLYYWLFPKKLEEKRERKRLEKQAREQKLVSDLLYEYEKLVKRRAALEEKVRKEANALQNFSWKIRGISGKDAYAERLNRESGKSTVESFNTDRLSDYEEIKELAVELENVSVRLFAIKQELKLYDIDKGDDDGI